MNFNSDNKTEDQMRLMRIEREIMFLREMVMVLLPIAQKAYFGDKMAQGYINRLKNSDQRVNPSNP